MTDAQINLIFGLIFVLGAVCCTVYSTFRVANRLKEQADRIEAATKRIELATGPAQVRQNIVNRYTHARIDDLETKPPDDHTI